MKCPICNNPTLEIQILLGGDSNSLSVKCERIDPNCGFNWNLFDHDILKLAIEQYEEMSSRNPLLRRKTD